jgi:hypothetical protein
MEEKIHYTEKEIQGVLENSFSGNLDAFHLHMKVCENCRNKFEAYKQIGDLIRNETIQFADTTSIIDLAWKKVQANRTADVFDTFQYWLIVTSCCVVVAICLGYLMTLGVSGVALIGISGFIGVFLLVSFKEIKLMTGLNDGV